ncbi:MAG: 2-C-methyl-D-erythritol 2,4-cyclodiphosphate synthase [Chloroflexota bacterium]|nr:2-C-methyl-D-erythritol 2,4-cyclodiphosphate synthase [Chloroflexota bacterium]
MKFRVGIGYDIHRLTPGRPLVLGGVVFESPVGLEGHSDADVVLHALMDAMLGATGLGDIGQHFPPSDERFHHVSSLSLLDQVYTLTSDEGYTACNADLVVVCEMPKIGPRAPEMRWKIAHILRMDTAVVSIKATTNEGLGPEGRGEAISSQAVVLMERRE